MSIYWFQPGHRIVTNFSIQHDRDEITNTIPCGAHFLGCKGNPCFTFSSAVNPYSNFSYARPSICEIRVKAKSESFLIQIAVKVGKKR